MSDWKVNIEPFLWSWLVSIEMHVSYYGLSGAISVIQADRSLYGEKCAIVFSFCFCYLFIFFYLYAAASDNVILHCSPLLTTRDDHLWTHCSALMARSRRQNFFFFLKKQEPCKTVTLLFMFDREAVQVCVWEKTVSLGLRKHEQTRTVVASWFLFFCHSILSQGSHTLFQANKNTTARWPTEFTAWSGPACLSSHFRE